MSHAMLLVQKEVQPSCALCRFLKFASLPLQMGPFCLQEYLNLDLSVEPDAAEAEVPASMPLHGFDIETSDDDVFEPETASNGQMAHPRRSDSQYSSLSSSEPSSTAGSTPVLHYRQVVSSQLEPVAVHLPPRSHPNVRIDGGKYVRLSEDGENQTLRLKQPNYVDDETYFSDKEEEEEDPLSCLERGSTDGSDHERDFEESMPIVGVQKETAACGKQKVKSNANLHPNSDSQKSKEPLMHVFYSSDKVECVTCAFS